MHIETGKPYCPTGTDNYCISSLCRTVVEIQISFFFSADIDPSESPGSSRLVPSRGAMPRVKLNQNWFEQRNIKHDWIKFAPRANSSVIRHDGCRAKDWQFTLNIRIRFYILSAEYNLLFLNYSC